MASVEAALKDVDLEEGGREGRGKGGGALGVASASGGGGEAGRVPATADVAAAVLAESSRDAEDDVEAGMSEGAIQRPPDGTTIGDAMQGVGEDERPYNYICNLDKVNLGGPGWFNDVFKISVEVDSERTWMDTLSMSLVPRHIFQRYCKLLDASQHITGAVTVEAPPSKRVWLAGVTVTFEEYLITVDSDRGEKVGAVEAQVAIGQFVSGKATFNFSLDLELLDSHRRWPVRETYVGELMAMRHRIVVAAQRPWYTFNVYSQIPIAMESVTYAPEEDLGQDNEEGGPNHVLIISDCNGRCEFDFGVDSYNLGKTLSGMVVFSDLTHPIVSAHVMLLKAEFMYGEASEMLVAEHTILGERRRKAPSGRPAASDEERVDRQFMSPFVDQRHVHFVQTREEGCRDKAVFENAELSVNMPLEDLPLTPSYMSLTQDITTLIDEAELVGVRYYIRLIVQDSNQDIYWHTHEIFFHRSEPSPSSGDYEDDDDDSNSNSPSSDSGDDDGSYTSEEATGGEKETTAAKNVNNGVSSPPLSNGDEPAPETAETETAETETGEIETAQTDGDGLLIQDSALEKGQLDPIQPSQPQQGSPFQGGERSDGRLDDAGVGRKDWDSLR